MTTCVALTAWSFPRDWADVMSRGAPSVFSKHSTRDARCDIHAVIRRLLKPRARRDSLALREVNTVLGNPTRKRGLRPIFLAYASGYQVFKQHQFVLTALASEYCSTRRSVLSAHTVMRPDGTRRHFLCTSPISRHTVCDQRKFEQSRRIH